jgi:spoIIIJ-associated protein
VHGPLPGNGAVLDAGDSAVEWVETTGRTVEEAKDAALDQLGVAEDDAEFEVLEEPRVGLFGRLRNEARVRARVRPTTPRPKEDRRDRRRRRDRPADGERAARDPVNAERASTEPAKPRNRESAGGQRPTPRRTARPAAPADDRTNTEDGDQSMDVPLLEQAEVARGFLLGLTREFGVEADVITVEMDPDTVELQVTGEDLGLLIGPKGQTLAAIQDLARTAVQRRTGGSNGRLLVDIAGYRAKRRVALEAFTRQQVERVISSGQRLALEPMSAADRKVVHDTVNDIDGVVTTSEGEDPRRRVVISPESQPD